MSGTTPNGITYPDLSDAPNIVEMQTMATSIDPLVIGHFASDSARAAAIATPVDGQLSFRSDVQQYERWSAAASAWVAQPGQEIAYQGLAAQTDFGNANTTAITLSVPVVANRKYLAVCSVTGLQVTNSTSSLTVHFTIDGTEVGRPLTTVALASNETASGTFVKRWKPTSTGSKTITVSVQNSASAFRIAADGLFVSVVDVGA